MRRAASAGLLALLASIAACASRSDAPSTASPSSAPTTAASTVATSTTFATTATSTAARATTTSAAPTAADCVRALDLATRVAQLVWPSIEGDALADRAGDFAAWGVGGALLMSWSDSARAEDLAAFKTAGDVPLLIATDEEGGTVQRLRRLGRLPPAAQVATTMTAEEAESLIAEHTQAVAALGIDVVFAPVVDVDPPGGEGPLGNRTFGDDPAVVAAFAAAYVRAWHAAGVLPVLKHFPGHGAATADTHSGRATTASLDALRERDLLPYIDLAGSDAGVMVGHLDVPGLTDADGVPASLSRAAIALLRSLPRYSDVLVFTDALDMSAVSDTWGLTDAARMAIAAGADVVIFTVTDNTPLIIAALVDGVRLGTIPESRIDESVLRVFDQKRIDPCTLVE